MKAFFINGSPRKNWNTAQLLKSAMAGAEAAGAETELIQLSDYRFSGCRSCFVCKRSNSPAKGVCVLKDELQPVLERIIREADVIVIGSPIYFSNLSADTYAFMERLTYPVLRYRKPVNGVRPRTLEKEKRMGMIITMNCTDELASKMGLKKHYASVAATYSGFLGNGKCPIVYCGDSYQFDDYSLYDNDMFDPVHKKQHHDKNFPLVSEKAFELGRSLCEN